MSFRILNRRVSRDIGIKAAWAVWAAVNMFWRFLDWVQDRLAAILVAVCAYQMRWFAIRHRFFKGISDTSPPRFCQFVALFLCVPCFHASNFFFQNLFALNERKLFYQSRVQARLGFPTLLLKLEDSGFDVYGPFQVEKRLAEFKRRLDAAGGDRYACTVHKGASHVLAANA